MFSFITIIFVFFTFCFFSSQTETETDRQTDRQTDRRSQSLRQRIPFQTEVCTVRMAKQQQKQICTQQQEPPSLLPFFLPSFLPPPPPPSSFLPSFLHSVPFLDLLFFFLSCLILLSFLISFPPLPPLFFFFFLVCVFAPFFSHYCSMQRPLDTSLPLSVQNNWIMLKLKKKGKIFRK